MSKVANDNPSRSQIADQLAALLEYRNRPDSPPDPLRSSWTTDPATVIPDGAFDGDDEPDELAEDLLLEITPSIAKIRHEVEIGVVTYGKAAPEEEGRPKPVHRQILAIGKLKFSDGGQHEQAMVNGATGVELKRVLMRPGAMLGTTEKLGGAHGGSAPAVVTISNTNLTGRLMGWEVDDEGKPTKKPKNHRPYTPAVSNRRKGKSLTPSQSRANLAKAIANTPSMPPVTKFPPGVASGTARYSDQFIGMKIGSTGKSGAPNWVDEFMAMRDHQDWQARVREADPKHVRVIEAAMTAKTIAELGDHGHRRTMERQGWRKLTAANDNFAQSERKFGS